MDLGTYMNSDATDLYSKLQKGDITSKDLVDLCFQQMEKVNPTLNAVIHQRKSDALDEATLNNMTGPFAGVPFLLKNISQGMEGEPLTSGTRLMEGVIAETDSHLVKKLRDAGFIMTGHTNVPEFALKNITEPELYGPTRNPWNTEHSPGGSSGGAAAAIASGIVPAAGASDGGGSIRIPASFTSLFGLKPTRGRTPVGPGAGRQWQGASIDFALSRSVRD